MRRLSALRVSAVAFGALLTLLSPTVGWADQCRPQKLIVEKGEIVWYPLHGVRKDLEFEIVEKGDPLVAKIEPLAEIDEPDLVLKITGTGNGTKELQVNWQGPNVEGSCQVEVTVAE